MGRTKATTKAVRDTRGTSGTTTTVPSTSKPPPDVTSLLNKAQELVSQCDFELATKFILRILEKSPHHSDATELLGVVQLETGQLDEARQTFQTLIPPSPFAANPTPSSAHLYLAQLTDEDPHLALKHYQAAVDLLASQLKGKERTTPNTDDEAETKRMIIRALVGMIEIWMSDLCMEPEAERQCDSLIQLALQTDPSNPEALQTLASIRMSQERSEEAKQHAEQSWALWKDLDPDSPLLPPIPARLGLTKIFLELSLWASALVILQEVLAADDQNVDAWYLEGWCFYLMAEKAKETGQKVEDLSWEELGKDAWDCLDMCRTLHRSQGHPDEQLLQHTKQLIGDLEAGGIKPSIDADEPEGEEDWEDVSESDEEMDS